MGKKLSFCVTGGSGFIGSALCHYLCEKYPDVTIVNISKHTYAVSPRMVKFLEKFANYRFIPLDIYDTAQFYNFLVKYNAVRVYHLAAETHVDRSFQYPRDFLIANIEGTFSVLEAIRAMKKRAKLYYMGTDEIFGSVKEGFKAEDHMTKPENPYAATKVGCEALCNAWMASFNIPIVIGRSMNVYGPRQNPEKLIPKIITNIIAEKQYTLYKGNSLRGWSYVYDTAHAIDTIMTKGKNGGVYHVPPSAMKGVYDINEFLLNFMPEGKKLFQGYVGKRLKDDDRYALSGSKMQYELDWMPKFSWEAGMKATVEWYAQNKELWL